MRAKEMALQSVADEDLKRWIWRARSSVNRRDAPCEPSAPPPWAEAAARAADAAARDMIASAWRGPDKDRLECGERFSFVSNY